MRNFGKLKLKIVPLTISLVFLLNSTGHGIELSYSFHLRTQLLTTSDKDNDRLKKTLSIISNNDSGNLLPVISIKEEGVRQTGLHAKGYQNINDIVIKEMDEDAKKPMLEILCEANTLQEKKIKDVQTELMRNNWWLQNELREKGLPDERVSILIDDKCPIDIYNWSDEKLTDQQINTIARNLALFSIIKDGKALAKYRYILLDREQKKNPNSGEPLNGYGYYDHIRLYPNAFRYISHRVGGVSNLEGTVIHELSHCIADDIINEWFNKFGWGIARGENITLPSGEKSPFKLKEGFKERCVTSYAALLPSDDICESMVAAIKNPEIMDKEKLKDLQQAFLGPLRDYNKVIAVKFERYYGKDLSLPILESPVRFKARKSNLSSVVIKTIASRQKIKPLKDLTWEDDEDIMVYFRALPVAVGVFRRLQVSLEELRVMAGDQSPLELFNSTADSISPFGSDWGGTLKGTLALKKICGETEASSWFVYPEQLQKIGKAAKELIRLNPNKSITIYNYGSAGGGETYGIAINLKEKIPQQDFKIVGLDLNKQSIDKLDFIREQDVPKMLRTSIEKYFHELIPNLLNQRILELKPEFVNLAELKQADIRDVAANIEEINIIVANGFLGADIQGDALVSVLEDISSKLSRGGYLFVENSQYHNYKYKNIFFDSIAKHVKSGAFIEIEPGIYRVPLKKSIADQLNAKPGSSALKNSL